MTTSFPATEHNVEFSLAYDDSHWGLPIVFNPYVKLFYAASRAARPSCSASAATPTTSKSAWCRRSTSQEVLGVPLIFSAPTWITVGPEELLEQK